MLLILLVFCVGLFLGEGVYVVHLVSYLCCGLFSLGIYNYICNQCLSPLRLWIRILSMARCTRQNIMWCLLVVFSGNLLSKEIMYIQIIYLSVICFPNRPSVLFLLRGGGVSMLLIFFVLFVFVLCLVLNVASVSELSILDYLFGFL
jgi:hypothetical protein